MTQTDRPLDWVDIVKPDKENPAVIESQEAEKERVYGYLNHCREAGTEPNSYNNYREYQAKSDQ